MAVQTTVYAWLGQYYLDFKDLPLAGLQALIQELKLESSRTGYNFQEQQLLEQAEAWYRQKTNAKC